MATANKDKGNKGKGKEEKKKKTTGQGNVVILPNGQRRIDFIKNQYYEKGATRSQIRDAINKMYEDAKQPGKKIAYQIVFAGTKQKVEEYKAAKKAAATAASKK